MKDLSHRRAKIAAVPPEVREVSDLPARLPIAFLGLRPNWLGRSPGELKHPPTGRAQPFRTSGGRAAGKSNNLARLSFILCAALWLFNAQPAAAQSFELAVEHEHTLRNCRGTLVITPEQIEYKTAQQHDAQRWRYDEVRQIKIEAATALTLVTYADQRRLLGRDRIFKFRLLDGEINAELSALLLAHAAKPIVTSVPPVTAGAPAFAVPVKHLHSFGGCLGTLKFYPDHVVYETPAAPSETRYWRYGDLHNFSQSSRYRFELTSFEEQFGGPRAYNFQLRTELPAGLYDYVWQRVYPVKFQTPK